METSLPPGTDLKDHGPEIDRVTAIVAALGTSAVILRLISRKLKKSSPELSDYILMFGLIIAWGGAAIVFIGILEVPLELQFLLKDRSLQAFPMDLVNTAKCCD